jgi:hypothetical protein
MESASCFTSNHPIDHKLGVVRTLYHSANTVIAELDDQSSEKEHISAALAACGYPQWAITKAVKVRNR